MYAYPFIVRTGTAAVVLGQLLPIFFRRPQDTARHRCDSKMNSSREN